MPVAVSLGDRIIEQAAEAPNRIALSFFPSAGGRTDVSYADLDRRSNQLARLLESQGVRPGDRVGIGLRNSPEHVIAALAAWKLGAGIVTMRWDVPAWERDRLLDVTNAVAVLTDHDGTTDAGIALLNVQRGAAMSDQPVATTTPVQPMAIPTGGSTGTSKAVLLPMPGELMPGAAFEFICQTYGIPPVERHLIMGPLYHANPLLMAHWALFDGQHVMLMEKFDPDQMVRVIDQTRPQFMTLAPTMMSRLLNADGIESVDWSCFHMILHTTAPCPDWLKRRWIALVGPQRLWETFASSELNGQLLVRGDEWLEHPGTVGRPSPATELRILDDEQRPVATGEVGEVYMRVAGVEEPLFDYLGADRPKVAPGGYVSVGDLAYQDAAGYVYSADRRQDLIITGGANVVPAEVEAALGEHPLVADVVVIGLPDDDWGQRVHALVQPTDPARPPSSEELRAFAKARLSPYKVPKSIELIESLPRSEMFKVRRSALVAERIDLAPAQLH